MPACSLWGRRFSWWSISSSAISSCCWFFFFQAEDGIRDHCVTGVQTCALPISMDVPVEINRMLFEYDQVIIIGPVFPHEVVGFSGGNKYLFPGVGGPAILNFFHWLRSEERRVGKECRVRCAPYHENQARGKYDV